MVPCITKPTRITKSSATLIDNIFVPLNLVSSVSSYIVIEDMTDHLPIILKIRAMFNLEEKKQTLIESRDFRPEKCRKIEAIN